MYPDMYIRGIERGRNVIGRLIQPSKVEKFCEDERRRQGSVHEVLGSSGGIRGKSFQLLIF